MRPTVLPLASLLLLAAPLAAQAQAKAPAAKEAACTDGKVKSPDTQGHCCWPNQVWSSLRNTCVGIPACPAGMTTEGENCTVSCPAGQAVSPDTQGHCCYPNQVWSSSRNLCVGIPACPQGMRAEGETCAVACQVAGQVVTPDTQGHCCWPNQVWSNSRFACMGVPTCPDGLTVQGTECVAPAPPPEPAPVATPEPAPVATPEPVPVPADAAPVPMDAAPVPIDGSTPSYTAPSTQVAVQQTRAEQEEAALKRSLWALGVDFLMDMSSGRFGLRLRTDIPLVRGHWVPFLGFGVGILPPSFTLATNNATWAIPLEATVGMRIPLLTPEPRFHIIPRAGATGFLLTSPRPQFGLKVLLGVGGRVNFGSSFGVNLGVDLLIPAVGTGFVWLTTLGISV